MPLVLYNYMHNHDTGPEEEWLPGFPNMLLPGPTPTPNALNARCEQQQEQPVRPPFLTE
jgi:hypothetical protein